MGITRFACSKTLPNSSSSATTMAAFELILSHARRHCTPSSQHSHFSSLLLRSSSHLQPSQTKNLTFCKSSSTLFTSSNSSSQSSFLGFQRLFFSSESSKEAEEETVKTPSQPPRPPPIKPVSYAIKPKAPEEEEISEKRKEVWRQREEREERRGEEAVNAGGAEEERRVNAGGGGRSWTREDIRYVKDVPTISPVSYPSRVANLPEDRVAATGEEGERGESGRDNVLLERERRRIETDARLRRVLRVEEEQKALPFPTLIKVEKKKSKVVLDLQEAIREVKVNAKRNFVETVEAHVGLGVDPRRGDQMVRGAATLPHGTGKVVRVAVFAEGDAAEDARAAGADIVGAEDLIEEIRKGGGKLNFDKCIATPIFMPRLGKIARILGPRGLMPNPKLGSVTSDVTSAVQEAKRGRIDFKIDKTAIVHVGLGKVNFSEEALRENVGAFVNALLLAKPVGLKKTSKYAGYVNSFSLCSTMGPGFPVSIQSLSMAADHYNKLQLK